MKVSEIPYHRYDVNKIINLFFAAEKELKTAKSGEEVKKIREKVVEEEVALDTAFNLAFIRWSINTADEFYVAEKEYYDQNLPKTYKSKSAYRKAFLAAAEKFGGDYPPSLLSVIKYKLISENEKIESEAAAENALVSEYSDFMSALTVDYNGESLPVTIIKGYMSDGDRAIREKAHNALGAALKTNAEFLDNNFDALVKNRDKQAKILGFKNYTELSFYRMNRTSYKEAELNSLKNSVKKYIVPALTRLRGEIAEKLGIETLKIYDLSAVTRSLPPKPVASGADLLENGRKMYREMSVDTGKFFDFMLNSDAFDVLSKKNKWGGGYETDIAGYNQPFILANFNGTSADADVLTHEAGHAYASYKMSEYRKDKELGLPFMDVAETHSMSMEFFCYKYITELFGKESEKYKFSHLIDSFTFIPYGVMVDEFQKIVYETPNLTPSERKATWLKLEKEYRPFFSNDGVTYFEDGGRWQYQMHVYESPFYYIDYVIAGLTAMQFLILSLENYDAAFEKYREFISLGADEGYLDLIEKCGLKSPFIEETIKEITEKISAVIDDFINRGACE